MVFARHVEQTRGAAGNTFGNLLIKVPLPSSMEGGVVNTIEKARLLPRLASLASPPSPRFPSPRFPRLA